MEVIGSYIDFAELTQLLNELAPAVGIGLLLGLVSMIVGWLASFLYRTSINRF